MKNLFWVLILSFSVLTFGQTKMGYELIDNQISKIPANSCSSTESIANYINSNFKTENEKIRAIFYWTASNIRYDVENMFAVNFNETSESKIKKSLETRKGVCINYAEIFKDIASKVGLKCVIIEGYTKQNGLADYISHAWCGAKVDGKWCIFDPTWGSGYIANGKFVKKINNYYFKTEPNKIIASHIPFDYLWEFLNYPVTNQEFYSGKTQMKSPKKYFNFDNEISKYEALSEIDKLISSAERIEGNGVKNAMIFDRLSYKKSEIEYYKFNQVTNLYNEGVGELNAFINFRNKQFKPAISDEELQKMIDNPRNKLLESQELLNKLDQIGTNNLANANLMKKGLIETIQQVDEQEIFVVKYLSKSKMARKAMFTKVSWFGIPLN
jgi:hypothetical protein